MIGIYFSGTGNTKYCLEKFVALYDRNIEITPLEDTGTMEKVTYHKDIIFAYPIYYSNLPKIVRDFICENSDVWKGKRIFIIATMGLFSGDGAGVSARLFERYGAQVWGGLHLKMPDCICDVKTLKRSIPQNRKLIKDATNKLIKASHQLKENRPPQEGINVFYHIAGLLGQRLWFYNKTRSYTDQLHIDPNACICCGKCAGLCPMKNISIIDNRVQAHDQCTMCYRCINQCPQRAITLIGKEVIEQHRVEDFL